MIPKKIHYCWFGRNPLTPMAIKCIESWKKYCPDYEITEWNEDNFDIAQNLYAKQAYDAKKWAFVSDYVRLKVLREHGGIYMDTDVELIKPIDAFLEEVAFTGFENKGQTVTGIMATERSGKWISKLLSYYDNATFLQESGEYDLTTNTAIITKMMVSTYGVRKDGTKQSIENVVTIYPKEYFCPKLATGDIVITNNTYAIHHFESSWMDELELRSKARAQKLSKCFGVTIGSYANAVIYNFQKGGIKRVAKKIIRKMVLLNKKK